MIMQKVVKGPYPPPNPSVSASFVNPSAFEKSFYAYAQKNGYEGDLETFKKEILNDLEDSTGKVEYEELKTQLAATEEIIGTIPSDAVSTNVVDYAQELLNNFKNSDYAKVVEESAQAAAEAKQAKEDFNSLRLSVNLSDGCLYINKEG